MTVGVPADPILHFDFDGPECRPLAAYTELQRAVMPVVGVTSEGLAPLATCFGISRAMPLVVTAWHVIRNFVRDHDQDLRAGTAHIAALWETDERIVGTDLDLGGPHPAYEIMYQEDSDLAVILLFEVSSGDRVLPPSAVAPLTFEVSPAADYCYGFGYPHLRGGTFRVEGRRRVVDFERTMHVCAGRVVEPFPEGQDGHMMVAGPSLHCDAPLPHGMSGGPVLTDKAGVCGAWSSALDPYHETDPWTSYVTLLHPMLEFHVTHLNKSIRDLVEDGTVEIEGPLPPPPASTPETRSIVLGAPGRDIRR